MAEIKASDVKALRDATGAGMMDCKAALQEADGDLEKAKEVLRLKGLAKSQKLSERSADEGVVEAYLHTPDPGMPPKVGVLVELNCSTDFVAKTDGFRKLAKDIALHIAATRPDYLSREDVPEDVIARERSIASEQAKGKPDHVVEKIVEGRLKDWFQERVLLEQIHIRDDKGKETIQDMLDKTTADVGEPVRIRRFARFRVGGE
ncbi:MAG: translation elongation factor Ts [Actinomycetota bacterium]